MKKKPRRKIRDATRDDLKGLCKKFEMEPDWMIWMIKAIAIVLDRDGIYMEEFMNSGGMGRFIDGFSAAYAMHKKLKQSEN